MGTKNSNEADSPSPPAGTHSHPPHVPCPPPPPPTPSQPPPPSVITSRRMNECSSRHPTPAGPGSKVPGCSRVSAKQSVQKRPLESEDEARRGPLEVPLQTLPVTVVRRTELVEAPAPTLSPTHDPSRSAALPRAAAASPHTTFAKGVCSQLQTVRAPDSSRHPPATTLPPTLLSSFACSSLGRRSLTNLLNHDHTMHVKTRHK
jgi:hypothetical protein